MTELKGKLAEIVYCNEANGYTVAFLSCQEEDVTIVGILPTVKEGEEVHVKGKWTVHSSYGRQFEVKEYQSIQPTTIEGIISYLSSGIVKGIGEKMAKRIVEKFGESTLEIMQQSPQRLKEVSGIGKAKAETIANAFLEQRELKEVVFLLSKYGVTPVYAVKIYKKYGEMSLTLIQENPYRLADDIKGIGFKMADQIAKAMGIPPHSMYRIKAAIKYILNKYNGEGHTYTPFKLLIDGVKDLINVSSEEANDAISNLALDQKIHLERLNNDEIIVYSMPYYYAETNTCKRLIELSQVDYKDKNTNIEELLNSITNDDFVLAKNQKEAIVQAVENGIMVITGGPGTGKTTTINTLIKVFERLDKKIMLAAPTGRASKRMSEATGREAKTIHRLLEMGFSDESDEMTFLKNEDQPLDADVIIIDEASMVDILLMNNLLKAIVLGTRLFLVGDVDQLPSVGAGNVLKDIIDSNIVKVVRLNEIFRQAQESMIIVNAHKINGGALPLLNEKDKDFYFITKNKKIDTVDTLIALVKERLPKHYKLDSLKDIQVLTPMKKGETGTLNLNKRLQDSLNPPGKYKAEKEYRDKILRVGDKVMQIRNNYTLKWTNISTDSQEEKGEGVFNGDIGYVHSIDLEDQELTVIFDEHRLVVYDFSQLDELELAYCVTVHKSQGSEFSVVVMPITWGPPMLLTRNLLYTAITRAKKLVVLVGVEKYLHEMVRNNRIVERYSGLSFRLKKIFDISRL
ncbi:ATP-dependent RecD-like DNA helicase [Alkaliphilus pronyensis]|uniref:ATP-dependent RecD2 DNA helicase n=1 Tax=Alkaliphilus pronyensis TaxID=1482732 RepID=A0A6I0F9N7_9FIRM|nr:ATP-dependent RecD-like DNA helicase [Alkaliphilus pronyensis]KAB3539681.1 ATP-dependent RecD-like DNA helicase [Alkaliphilus pronyensis]